MSSSSRKSSKLLFCILVFFSVYPLVTGLGYALQMIAQDWAIWQRNLIAVPIMVLAMVFVLIPFIQGLLALLAKRENASC